MKHLRDPLNMLIAAQAAYFFIGKIFLGFTTTWLEVVVTILVAVVTELSFSNFGSLRNGRPPEQIFVPRSAIAAAFGILLFFRSSSVWYFVVASFLAIASKYLIRIGDKHIFNPSNFGIVATVFVFTSATTIEFTQWGTNPLLYVAIALISLYISYRAKVSTITASFLGIYALLLAPATLYYPIIFSIHHYGLINPSIILFASFMITDPKTAPRGTFAQILHGISIAALYFCIGIAGIRYSLFVATFLIAILNVFARSLYAFFQKKNIFPSLPFNWTTSALILSIFAILSTNTVLHRTPQIESWPYSAKFLLFGIESSPRAKECKADTIFKESVGNGIGERAITNGTAWSDYNDDEYDDLFVSSNDVLSKLYRNNHDGTFTDVTSASGLPEFFSTSAFFADYDNDGRPDLFVNGQALKENGTRRIAGLRVYRNMGIGAFVDVTNTIGFENLQPADAPSTMSFGDYNNDGYVDLVGVTPGSTFLINAKQDNAMLKSLYDPQFPQSAWFICDPSLIQKLMPKLKDLAGDEVNSDPFRLFDPQHGCVLTKYHLNLLSWNQSGSTLSPADKISSAVLVSPGSANLFENKGGHFIQNKAFQDTIHQAMSLPKAEKITTANPIDYTSGIFWQPISFDYDSDGKIDIFFAMDTASSILLRNTGNFTFENRTKEAHVNLAGTGMGTDVSDYNHDGFLDLVVDNVREDYVYTNQGKGIFVNTPNNSNIGRAGIGWGVSFLDYNLDGWEDLFLVNGDIAQTIDTISSGIAQPYFRSDKLYRNDAGRGFTDVTGTDICADVKSGRTLAVSDYDNDGDPDMFIGNYDDSGNILYENTSAGKHYIGIRLQGTISNRMGIGAVVRVRSGEDVQTKQLTVGNSLYSQSSQKILFGFGTSSLPIDIEVFWPSGLKNTIHNVQTDRIITIKESR